MKYRALATALAALAVTGCSVIEDAHAQGETTKLNMQEVADRAEQILDDTLKAVRPGVEAGRGPSSDSACTDVKNDGTGTGTVTRRRYVTTIVSAARRGNFLGVVERSWKTAGYEITGVRESKERPAVFASTTEDFRVSLEFGYKGQAFFTVTSPCVTQSKVTEAPREPVDPDSPVGKGLPYVHSGFWSAATPAS
ncbi:hypothetical protein [Streptomyces anandii]|uniref:hypothetical protein n=1 Tax=Streptomyces anandii TaxID=285454 RepID=UPI000A5AEF25|nr:hypothetical protein [Streptomyces anandii]GGX66535.1 hypothetical protein GCM10010510_08430 [Streptomyces anandii JCM 4720]